MTIEHGRVLNNEFEMYPPIGTRERRRPAALQVSRGRSPRHPAHYFALQRELVRPREASSATPLNTRTSAARDSFCAVQI